MIKTKTLLLLLLLFVMSNGAIYYLTKNDTEYKIDLVLKDNLKTLQTHYKILLQTQKTTAKTIYQATIQLDGLIEILKEANSATLERKAELRESLRKLVEKKYKIIQQKGVLQYHFVLKNNESFYRAHKPSKFGDDLTDVRADLRYVNETKKVVRAFTQGRTAHAFRNTFPIFDKKSNYIGAIEVSFSSDSFQWYLNNISGIHSHFLVDKKIFEIKTWKRNDLILSYSQAAESSNYMITLGDIHTKKECIDDNKIKLQPIKKALNFKMHKGDDFSIFVEHHGHIEVLSLLAIKNIGQTTVAWIVSYEQSPIIESALHNKQLVRVITFLLSLLIIYFLLKEARSKQEIKIQHKVLNDILNATDNVMFVTDFVDVKFSNNKFKELTNISYTNLFNSESEHNILNIFVSAEGYLHKGLLQENEDFVSLVARTPLKDRVVSIVNKNLEPTAFKISITKSENNGDYVVTLSDITKLKEHQVQTEKKAYIDGLTKIYNRNKFDESIQDEIKYAQRYKTEFSIAILDIDKFKNFNDKHGHLVGDEVLVIMAQTVNKNVRDTDVFARWGGEEFVVLFRNTPADLAKVVSEKLKDKIEENEHATAGRITASFGVTGYIVGDTVMSMFKRCDSALYVAKENGRNRVEVL